MNFNKYLIELFGSQVCFMSMFILFGGLTNNYFFIFVIGGVICSIITYNLPENYYYGGIIHRLAKKDLKI